MQHARRKLLVTWSGGRTWNINVACFLVVLGLKITFCQNTCSSGPCYPAPLDIAGHFNVTANSTCGDPEEPFCVNLNCSYLCKANSPGLAHPSSFVTDNKDATFWKSVNFEYPVVLQLDIERTFMLYQSIVTFYHELPAAMYLLKSNDSGRTYTPISYFATDCLQFFNLSETPENEVEGLKVQCFKIDRATNPSKQLYYSPMQDVTTAQNLLTDTQKQAFFLMTNLRMVLVKFITPSEFDPAALPESLKRSYFFSVLDWDVLASCHCNGQASKCDPNDQSKCLCERNTEGVNCERCLPLFNNKPYQIRETCEDCGCHNHSESCTYNKTKGYGVCDDCLHNTMGDKCNQCKPSYYRNSDVLFSHVNTCLACGCHGPGVKSSADSSLQCNNETGQCTCKSRVTGRVCDTCHDGFWNLNIVNEHGCEECGCNTTGTVNASNICNKETGQCPCKPLLTGRTCNKCQDGYYGLTVQNPGCSVCNCNPAGSFNQTCSSTGHCFCRPRFFGDKCENIERGFFVPSVDYVTYQAEDASLSPPQEMRINHTTVTNSDGASILVLGVVLTEGDSGASPTKLSFIINLPKTAFFSFILRYMTSYQWELIKITVLLRSPTFAPFSCKDSQQVTRNEPHILIANVSSSRDALNFGSRCLLGGQYTVDLEIPFGSAVPAVMSRRRRRAVSEQYIVVDSIVVMPTLTESIAFQEASLSTQENMTFYYNESFSLRTWTANLEEGSAALSPVFGELFGEGQACNCSLVGSDNPQECQPNGGQCECKAHVIGRTCEQCRPDYFNFTSGQGCQACNCTLIGSKQTSCHPDTGQCSCMNNVTGLHCDRCQRYYYNFHSGLGCSPCNCHPTYSNDLQCDGSTGMCSCKPGINGGKCTACQNQFYNLSDTGCLSCDCDPAGSLTLTCNKTSGQCPCKVQALGPVCSECPVGFYGLSTHHPDGCLRCQCSNKSSSCLSDTGWFISKITTTLSTVVDNVEKDGWSAVNGEGQTVESLLDWNIMAVPFEKGSIKVDTSAFEEIYFNAPAKYLGDQRFAYTHSLSFKLQQDNASSPANSSNGDVILTGRWFNQPLVTALDSPPPEGERFKEYTVKLFESYWRVGTTSGRQPSSSELIVVLSDLTSLRIRAKWTSLYSQLYSRIGDISLTVSNRTSVLPQLENASNVEDCRCPYEYEGQFCEQCAIGFTRVIPNGGPYVGCSTCMCNGHSDTCDPETGVCLNCQHNTAGDHCDKCSDGWYGNATNGTSQDCKPCPCPGGPSAPNQFAKTCKLDSDGLPTCVNCSEGHMGRYCEFCRDGYFGQPMEENGECLLCSCNDNIDLGATGNCNSTSGECLKCLYNTSGFNCEWCAPGFHGNARNKTCKECTCSDVGATSNFCHNISGTCDCQPLVNGKFCDKCEENAYNFTRSGCMPCKCDGDGSTDLQCDLMLGNCSCHRNVIGAKCNKCSKGSFNVTQGCQDCDCTANQTIANTTCNAETGQCECSISLAGGKYGGRQCEKCSVHTVGSPPSCYPCTEQCFLNWFNIIANESTKIDLLSEEVTRMLKSFGSMSVDHINHTLQDLYSNVSYAKQILQSGGREDLEKRQYQINQIQKSIRELQQHLNDSKDLIDDAQEYLTDHVTNFNGSVQITPVMYPSLPTVCPSGGGLSIIINWQCIEAMALTYRQRAFQANESARANYASIQSSYDMIELANVTAFRAARQVNESLDKLEEVSIKREQVESGLGANFQSLYLNHSMRLAEIRTLMQTLEELLSQSKTFTEQANASVSDAEKTSVQARNVTSERKREAQNAVNNATNAQSEALQAHDLAENALRLATEFKENATRVLKQTQDALRNVTTGINTIGRVNNMTQESISISDVVKVMNMPVSLKEIQRLADDILSTDVSEELVNQTLEKAEKSLQQAREVERLSQRAVNVSRKTLQSMEEIEKTMFMAEQYRREALDLQQQTDVLIENITNITQTIEQRFSVAHSAGQSLLTEINTTLIDLEEGLMCFDTAKNEAQNASNTARMAFNISKKAKEIFENSSASLAPAAALVNSSYEEANTSVAEVEQVQQDSVQLLKDVTEAQVLLQQYIDQREELEKLGQEITQLDREADDLLTKFSEAAERYGQCAGAL